jgi:hypothetical protein
MKNRFAFWMVIGIGIGTAAGAAYGNIPAGVTLGACFGTLANLLTWLNVFHRDNK